MPRLLFEKTGEAVWISHLDLMRLFQRAFKRAGLPLTHTQGYNPRPSVAIALPLSVGVESMCELLDFDLEGERLDCGQIKDRLNAVLVKGIRILDCYETGKKIKDLALLNCSVRLEYDAGVPDNAEQVLRELYSRQILLVEKKSKNGMTEQDIIPMIRSFSIETVDSHILQISAMICCQNPSMNPMQFVTAIERYVPTYKPDHAICRRQELFDVNENVFR